jgi:hypothetical protein
MPAPEMLSKESRPIGVSAMLMDHKTGMST